MINKDFSVLPVLMMPTFFQVNINGTKEVIYTQVGLSHAVVGLILDLIELQSKIEDILNNVTNNRCSQMIYLLI